MSANVVRFNGITKLELPVQTILDKAAEAGLTEIVVIGIDADGDEYFASSQAGGPDVLWHLERARHKLMKVVDEQAE
jgi:hypothetical protein